MYPLHRCTPSFRRRANVGFPFDCSKGRYTTFLKESSIHNFRLYRSGLLMSQRLHGLYPPGVTSESFEECGIFPVGHKRLGKRLLQ